MTRRHPLRPLALLALLALAATACGGDGDDGRGPAATGEPSAGSVTVYSGRTEELIQPIIDDFEEATGISVDVRYGDSAELALLINEEGDRSPADVFISQSPGALGFLAQHDLLAPLSDDVLSLVEPQNRAADGTWVGFSGRQRVLVYNTDLVDPADLPGSVLDLTDPAYDGLVGVAPANGSFQDFVTAMRHEQGDEATSDWLEGLVANHARTYANNSAIVEAVGRGEVPFGLVNHYYNHRTLAADPSAPSVNHNFAPDDIGSLVIVTGVAVLGPSDAADDAASLVAFLLGETAQTFFSQETFEYPLAAGVAPAVDLPALAGTTSDPVDYDSLGGGLEGTVELIAEAGLSG